MSHDLDLPVEQTVHFGPYHVHPRQRLVLEAGQPLRLGRRAVEILLVLLEHAGQVVSKQQLIARVWPRSVVEDTNLRVHVAALRKALGDGQAGQRYIVTVAQRGYSFVAPISFEPFERQAPIPHPSSTHNLPLPRNRMIGRQAILENLVAQLPRKRFITLVGTGGIGKTTVALRVAERLIGHYRDGTYLLDLASLNDPAMIAPNLCALLELPPYGGEALDVIVRQFKERHLLLVIDNCEHLIDAVAQFCETLLRGAPHLHILATSREDLRAEGEYVQRLDALAFPPREMPIEGYPALQYPALQLFAERAMASLESFELTDREVPLVVDICQRLDGIPLAIELAAAQIGRFGLDALHRQLHDSVALLHQDRESGAPRQQTLRATLDWSFALLTPCEQTCLRRLAVFMGSFNLASAAAVIIGPHVAPDQMLVSISQLVAKSLLNVELGDEEVRYRLLDTTRSYALEKLAEAAELSASQARHAERCLALMEQAEKDWENTPTRLWIARYADYRDDIRAALDRGLAPQGAHAVAIRLTARTLPLWQELSLLKEHGLYVNKALALLRASPMPCPRLTLALELARGSFSYHTEGGTPATIDAFITARQLAQQCQDLTSELRAVSGHMAVNLSCGHYRQALEQSEDFDRLGMHDPILSLSTQRLRVLALHFDGNQDAARHDAEQVLQRLAQSGHLSRFTHGFGVQYDQSVAALTMLARILWLQGFAEKARRTASLALQIALQINHGTSICYTLALAGCVIEHYNGDPASARERLQMLRHQAKKHSVMLFHGWADRYADAFEGVPVQAGLAATGLIQDIVVTLRADQVCPDQVERAHDGTAGWCTAEILRAGAQALLAQEDPAMEKRAEVQLQAALKVAREQHALAWELRSAMSLARLWLRQGQEQAARNLLEPVYRRFSEGFETPDLVQADALLKAMSRRHGP